MKYILSRLVSLRPCWHEDMDLVFFFKAVNGLVDVSQDVLPKSHLQPELPDPPVATKFPFVRPNAKPLRTNTPFLFVYPEPGTHYQLH